MHGPRRRRRFLAPLLAALIAGGLHAADEVLTWQLDAPNPAFADGVLRVENGFLLRRDRTLLAGDRLIWHQAEGRIIAEGRVLLAEPGLRLEAERLSLSQNGDQGEGGPVRVLVMLGERRLRLEAAAISFDQQRIVLHEVAVNGGHGGLLAVSAKRIEIGRRLEPEETRREPARSFTHLLIRQARISAGGWPLLYSPVLYRDWRLDWPWTRYEVGSGSRSGPFIRGWLALGLPPIAGLSTTVRVRGDAYDETGSAWGAEAAWHHTVLGQGRVMRYGFNNEAVIRQGDEVLEYRRALVVDAEHRVNLGSGLLAGRWTRLPPGDNDGAFRDERFRSDYLEEELRERPFARRGGNLAWTLPGVSVDGGIDRRPDGVDFGTDRLWYGTAAFTGLTLGPVRVSGDLQHDELLRHNNDHRSGRTRAEARAEWVRWFSGGLGLELGAGGTWLAYDDGQMGATTIEEAHRWVPNASIGVGLRIVGEPGPDLIHRSTVTTRLRQYRPGRGDELPAWNFADGGDELEEDLLLGELELLSDLYRGRALLARLRFLADWDLEDRRRTPRQLRGQLELRPTASLRLAGNVRWDGETRRTQSADFSGDWVVSPQLRWFGETTFVPDSSDDDDDGFWNYEIGGAVSSQRYSLEVAAGRDVRDDNRRLRVTVGRIMVDGVINVETTIDRNPEGTDVGILIGFSIDGFSGQ